VLPQVPEPGAGLPGGEPLPQESPHGEPIAALRRELVLLDEGVGLGPGAEGPADSLAFTRASACQARPRRRTDPIPLTPCGRAGTREVVTKTLSGVRWVG